MSEERKDLHPEELEDVAGGLLLGAAMEESIKPRKIDASVHILPFMTGLFLKEEDAEADDLGTKNPG